MTDDILRTDIGETWTPPKFAIASNVYAERDGKILLLKRKMGAFAGQWFVPGGALDEGESPVECATRELREESGLEVEEEPELVGAYFAYIYGHRWLMLTFRVPVRGEIVLSDEHDGARWVDPLDMRAFMSDENLLEIARGNEAIAAGLTLIRDDLDRYIKKIGRAPA